MIKHLLTAFLIFFMLGCRGGESGKSDRLRIGFFPNVTHGQALYAKATGAFQGIDSAGVEWFKFNAGPSAIEAMFAGEIDAAYIGPSPTVNGYVKSHGEKFVIAAGAAMGGAGLVVAKDSGITGENDFHGKVIATPQYGNTQDFAARNWFLKRGYTFKEKGGDLSILPIENPDQLGLMKRGEIHGAWSIEPWLSRLQLEAGARLFLDEKDLWSDGRYVTTHLILSRDLLKNKPETARKLIEAHVKVTQQINADLERAGKTIADQIAAESGSRLSEEVLASALKRIRFSWDPAPASLHLSVENAFKNGLLKEQPSLAGIYDLKILNETLKKQNLPEIVG